MSKKYIGSYDYEILNNYFKEIKDALPLSQEEEVELANRIREYDDEEAIEKLVVSNLKFVISIAKEYQGCGIPLSDLINEGNLGLIKAAYKFDPTRGFKFISYAVWWVKQSIMQSINDNSRMIRLPTNIINKISLIKKEINEYELLYGEEAIISELESNDSDYSEVEIESYNNTNCKSLNSYINDDGDELGELLPYSVQEEDEDYYEVTDRLKDELENTLSILDDRERDIIECYFGINRDSGAMTLEAIGDKYAISKERIRQIKEKAIRKLRHNAYNLYKVLSE